MTEVEYRGMHFHAADDRLIISCSDAYFNLKSTSLSSSMTCE